ncbi:MAG: XRE family transcriptional regulator [Bacteroidales bacterium]|nr:XRE family transcriptional regulator [Bacteroidales bacterium]
MINKKGIHIGQLIREELRRQGKTNAWFAKQMNLHLRTVQKIFNKEYVDTYQLLKISQILHTDFFKYYSEQLDTAPN